MTILYYVLMTLHIVSCLFLIGVVLLQQGKNQDLASAFGGGGTQTAFGPRGSATVLSRATAILAGVFMLTSMGLSLVKPRASGILDRVPTTTSAPAPKPVASAVPAAVPPPAAPATAPAGGPAEAPAPAASPAAGKPAGR